MGPQYLQLWLRFLVRYKRNAPAWSGHMKGITWWIILLCSTVIKIILDACAVYINSPLEVIDSILQHGKREGEEKGVGGVEKTVLLIFKH